MNDSKSLHNLDKIDDLFFVILFRFDRTFIIALFSIFEIHYNVRHGLKMNDSKSLHNLDKIDDLFFVILFRFDRTFIIALFSIFEIHYNVAL